MTLRINITYLPTHTRAPEILQTNTEHTINFVSGSVHTLSLSLSPPPLSLSLSLSGNSLSCRNNEQSVLGREMDRHYHTTKIIWVINLSRASLELKMLTKIPRTVSLCLKATANIPLFHKKIYIK